MKSHVRNQLELMKCIYQDAFIKCVAAQPALRDVVTITSRIKDEGLSFLTITLPAFGKDFERSLADGCIGSTAFRSFKKVGAIPAFLQGMLSHVFDRVTGRILDEEHLDISCIEGIRQVAYAFKKLEMDCTQDRVQSAIDSFIQVEHDLSEFRLLDENRDLFDRVSQVLWNDFSDCNIRDLIPKHGPGATAERVSGNQKHVWQYWHNRLEPYFPLIDTAFTLGSYQSREFENVLIVAEEHEQPVRVTPVPKTQKGPRIIAIEPCCMQYTQQAIRAYLYDRIERLPLTAGHVNFTDQSINRMLAMRSSIDGQLATIDLSDASDRVLSDLALSMFNSYPDLKDAIDSCRSTRAKLPDGRVIGPLRKFASMGSALCFPIESMYFYTICVGALLKEQNLPVTFRNVMLVSRNVYVYGDDIIIPRKWATVVVSYLQKYCCKVNMSKSFWSGNFRESCGMDAYNGVEVTPTYIRKLRPNNKRQASELISWVETANHFERKGYVSTSAYMFRVCESILGKLPNIAETSQALGRVSLHSHTTERYNVNLQRSEVRAWIAEPVYRTDKLEGYGALMKCLLSLNKKIDSIVNPQVKDHKHLERSAQHGAVALKRRWVAA